MHLYVEYVKERLPMNVCKLVLLKGLEGAHDSIGTGDAKKVQNGIGLSQRKQGLPNSQHAPDAIVKQYWHTGAMFPERWSFPLFTKQVLNDAIDVDQYKPFADFCKTGPYAKALKKMKAEFRVAAGYEMGSHVQKESKPALRSAQAEANYVCGYLREVNSGRLEEPHPTMKLPEQRKLLWEYAVANGYVLKVTLDETKLKEDFTEAARLRNIENPENPVVLPTDHAEHQLQHILHILPKPWSEYQKEKPSGQKKKKTAPGTPSTPTVPPPDNGDIATPTRRTASTPQLFPAHPHDGTAKHPIKIEVEEKESYDEEMAAQYEAEMKLAEANRKASSERQAEEKKRKRQAEKEQEKLKKRKQEAREAAKLEKKKQQQSQDPSSPVAGKLEQDDPTKCQSPPGRVLRPRSEISYAETGSGSKPKQGGSKGKGKGSGK